MCREKVPWRVLGNRTLGQSPKEIAMKKLNNGLLLAAVMVIAIGCVVLANHRAGAGGADKAAAAPPRYTGVSTEGHNLIVTDNTTNKLHFYTIGPDDKIGDPLHLRGSVDLTQVGKKTITPTTYKKATPK